MTLVRYGVNKSVKKPDLASDLPSTAKKHVAEVKQAELKGDKHGKAAERPAGELRRG